MVSKMNFNLIIEGCDGVGKTSTIGALMKVFNWKKVIKHKVFENQYEQKRENERAVVDVNVETGIIYDRFIWSDAIYPKVMDRYKTSYIKELERRLNKHNIVIILTANSKRLHDRYDNGYLPKEKLDEVNKEYIKLYNNLDVEHKLLIDTSEKNSFQIAQLIAMELVNILKI